MGETAKWYAIHTYSGYEVMVKTNLEKLIENNNLGDQILKFAKSMLKITKRAAKSVTNYHFSPSFCRASRMACPINSPALTGQCFPGSPGAARYLQAQPARTASDIPPGADASSR